jgi:ABC-type ATPase with predicted acetyltransferase domain
VGSVVATDFYILGTSHPLQCGSTECTPASIGAFDEELRRLCEIYKIQRISEEMTAEGLVHHKATETIGQRVARDAGITHQTVDLSQKERNVLSMGDSVVIATVQRQGIFDGGPFREAFDDLCDGIRERVWVARILSGKEWPVLVICGADHAVSVRRLCRGLGMNAKIAHRDY